MKRSHLPQAALAALLLLCLAGCGLTASQNPASQQVTSPTQELPAPLPPSAGPEDRQTAQPSQAGASQVYTAAQFGAPVNGTGLFPLDAACSASLAALVDASPEALSKCVPVQASDWMPLVELTRADGSIVSISRDGGQILLHAAGQHFDYTDLIDFDKLCRTLERSQLAAVLADLPELTRLNIDVPDVPSLNRDITLTPDESRFIWNTLQPDAWEIPDMYTAQDLAQGWGDFVALYSGDVRMALVEWGAVQGSTRTVIFYQINGEENQTAYILAPDGVYRTLFDWGSAAQCDWAAMAALQAVLTNDLTLVADNGRGASEYLLEDYLAQWPAPYMTIDRWALCDFDRDGTPEVVCNQRMGDNPFVARLILHYQDGTVYGYGRTYRALGAPKTDGTFDVDDGAFNHGIATISFEHENCMIHDITRCYVEYDQRKPHFVVNGAPGTSSEFDAAMQEHFAKPDVEWFDYTEAVIRDVFSAGAG